MNAATGSNEMPPDTEARTTWTPAALYSAAVLCSVVALGTADSQLKSLLLEPLKHDLRLTDTQFGQLGLAAGLCAVLAAFPLGWLSDRADRQRVLAGCVVVWSAATVAAGMAQNFNQLLTAGIALALGEAALLPMVYAMVPEHFNERQRAGVNAGLYAVILLSGGISLSLGGAVYRALESHPVALPYLQDVAPWRTLYFAFGLPGLAVALLMLTHRRGSSNIAPSSATPRPSSQPAHVGAGFGSFLRTHGLTIVMTDIALSIYATAWGLLSGWSPAILSRSFGLTVGDAGVVFGAVSMVANVVGILAGWWGARRWLPRWGTGAHLRLVMLGALAAILPIFALALANTATQYLAGVGIAMAVMGLATSQAPSIMQDMAPAAYRSRTISLFPLIALPVAGLGVAVGALSDRIGTADSLRIAVVSMAMVAIVVGFVLLAAVQKRYRALVVANKTLDA
ncbi:MAG: MFS transporter [Gammaproteobacteria bacterium]